MTDLTAFYWGLEQYLAKFGQEQTKPKCWIEPHSFIEIKKSKH